jgi:WD40 repeat protein
VRRAAFSLDGSHIVTASGDDTAWVWDAESGEKLLKLEGHIGAVLNAEYGPDGKRIITSSDDLTTRVWNAETGKELIQLQGHTDKVWSATYSPDGSKILTASGDQTARVWPATLEDLLAIADGLIQRDPPLLTAYERQRYGLE